MSPVSQVFHSYGVKDPMPREPATPRPDRASTSACRRRHRDELGICNANNLTIPKRPWYRGSRSETCSYACEFFEPRFSDQATIPTMASCMNLGFSYKMATTDACMRREPHDVTPSATGGCEPSLLHVHMCSCVPSRNRALGLVLTLSCAFLSKQMDFPWSLTRRTS